MSMDVLRALESEGYFDKARDGDHRACGLFARLAAYRLNPSGDPAGWGCLRKTGGGANVEGYSEDAIVLGSDPANVHNVVDIIVGAGRAGASIGWGVWRHGTDPRRATDIWEKPVPLTAEQMDYLKPGSGHVEPGNPPVPIPVPPVTPPVTVPCRFEPFNLAGLVTLIERQGAELAETRGELAVATDEVRQVKALLANLDARLQQGGVIDASMRYIGPVRGTVKF